MKIRAFYNQKSIKKININKEQFYCTIRQIVENRKSTRTIKVYAIQKGGAPIDLGIAIIYDGEFMTNEDCAAQIISKSFGYDHPNYHDFKKDFKDVSIFKMY